MEVGSQRFLEELLECSICRNSFETSGLRIPKMLPCQHTFCLDCIKNILSVKCPACRKVFHEPIEDLPNHFILLQLVNHQSNNKKYEATTERNKIKAIFIISIFLNIAMLVFLFFYHREEIISIPKKVTYLLFDIVVKILLVLSQILLSIFLYVLVICAEYIFAFSLFCVALHFYNKSPIPAIAPYLLVYLALCGLIYLLGTCAPYIGAAILMLFEYTVVILKFMWSALVYIFNLLVFLNKSFADD